MRRSTLRPSHWLRAGVLGIRTTGSRGRVRYRMQMRDGSVVSAGVFPTIGDALRHGHASATKRQRHVDRRFVPASSERWLWRSGDLEEIAAAARGGARA